MDVFLISLTLMMLLVIYFDLTSYTIPNWLNALVMVLYVPFVLVNTQTVDWQMASLGALVMFAVGFVVFTARWMGGGDIKLLIASALWVGWLGLMDYMLLVLLLGGALALLIWALRHVISWMQVAMHTQKNLPRLLQHGAPLPYGLAIAAAFLWRMWQGLMPGF